MAAGYRPGRGIIKDIHRAAILTDAVILQLEFASILAICVVNLILRDAPKDRVLDVPCWNNYNPRALSSLHVQL